MREVAALAGVSLKTVSRVVNQEAGVSAELTERVNKAVQLLGYHHNSAASNLRRNNNRTATIGLLVDDVSNPFCSELHRAIEDIARARNTLVFAGSTDDDPQREEDMALSLAERRIDGLIAFSANDDHNSLERVSRLGCPIVFVDRPATIAGADSVTVDNREGVTCAIKHLAQHGHQRIGFLSDLRSIWTASERYAGFVEGLAANGLRLDGRWVRQDLRDVASVFRATQQLLQQDEKDERPTALFTARNIVTVGAIQALQALRLQHQVALIGFDDIPLADLLEPRVSVVAQDPTAIGQKAVELLFARIDGDLQPAQHIVVPTRFLPRGSGEIGARR
jgi:LacI family transcriptional regulator